MTTTTRPARSQDHAVLPDPNLHPPVVAESGDPFAGLRIVHLIARLPIGLPMPVRSIVDRLKVEHLDWSFSERVVLDAIAQLRANWIADFRTQDGIQVEESNLGPSLVLEDSARTQPWLRDQAWRLEAECQAQLDEFARGEGRASEG